MMGEGGFTLTERALLAALDAREQAIVDLEAAAWHAALVVLEGKVAPYITRFEEDKVFFSVEGLEFQYRATDAKYPDGTDDSEALWVLCGLWHRVTSLAELGEALMKPPPTVEDATPSQNFGLSARVNPALR